MPLTEGQLRLGRLFESEFERQQHNRGNFVVRHCDQLGVQGTKAPMVTGLWAGYRLPDFSVIANNKMIWVEAKYKTLRTWTRAHDRFDHGIDLPNWRDYLAVCKLSSQEGWLVVGEGDTGNIVAASFNTLMQHAREYHGTQHFTHGAVFWPCDVFQPYGTLNRRTGNILFSIHAVTGQMQMFNDKVA